MAMNGTVCILYANTGTPAVPVYEKVGCQRDMSIDETTDAIDVSCKDSRAGRVLPGRYGSTISLDALYVPDDAAFMALQEANRNPDGEMILVAYEESGVVIATALALITSMSMSLPDQGEATISISLTVDGWWSEAGS